MSEKREYRFETLQVHAGQETPDPATGRSAPYRLPDGVVRV